jgi:hypothetical protein
VDLLAAGKNDTQVAELLNLSRPTVTRWRCYLPEFKAALNRQRADIWGAAGDRLRSLLPKALDALASILERGQDENARTRAALEILRLAQLSPAAAAIGATDADQIIDTLTEDRLKVKRAERLRGLSSTERLLAEIQSPSKEQEEADARAARAEVLAELEARLNEEECNGEA